MRVALERHERRDAHRAVVAHAPDIIAAQVDEHHMLGFLLLVALQFLTEAHVFLFGLAARPCPGDRMGDGVTALNAYQHFR